VRACGAWRPGGKEARWAARACGVPLCLPLSAERGSLVRHRTCDGQLAAGGGVALPVLCAAARLGGRAWHSSQNSSVAHIATTLPPSILAATIACWLSCWRTCLVLFIFSILPLRTPACGSAACLTAGSTTPWHYFYDGGVTAVRWHALGGLRVCGMAVRRAGFLLFVLQLPAL